MNIFDFRDRLVGDYANYVRSFIAIQDDRIQERVKTELAEGLLWPEPSIGLNPAFAKGAWIDELLLSRNIIQRALVILAMFGLTAKTNRSQNQQQAFQNSAFQCFQQLQWLPWDCQTLENTGKTKGSWVIAVGDCKDWTIHPMSSMNLANVSSHKPTSQD